MKNLIYILFAVFITACNLDTEPISDHEIKITKECPECTIQITLDDFTFSTPGNDSVYFFTVPTGKEVIIQTTDKSGASCIDRFDLEVWSNKIEWYDANGYNKLEMNCLWSKQVVIPQ